MGIRNYELTLRSGLISCGLLKPADPRYWGEIEDFLGKLRNVSYELGITNWGRVIRNS